MTRRLIAGGLVVDGTGSAGVRADLLIAGDRIEAVLSPGTGAGGADSVIDATGQVVCPGFIDIHSHGDLIFTLPPDRQRVLMEGRLGQGITTEIIGNCGLGVFPSTQQTEPVLQGIVAWMTPPEVERWEWRDLGGYLDRIERHGVCANVGALQPHGPLRIAAAGMHRELPGAGALRGMRRGLRQALDAGAFGLSTGLIYPPGIYTTTDEIVDLTTGMAQPGRDPFVASHIRGSSETLLPAAGELIEVGRRTGARVQHSHNEAVGRDHWHKLDAVLSLQAASRRQGVAVHYDMFPYTAAATMMLAIYPPWALEGGVEMLLARLADASARAAIREAIDKTVPSWPPWTPQGWPHNLVRAVGWERITIGSVGSRANRRCEGMSLAELGSARRLSPFDAIADLMLEEGGHVSQIIHGISGNESHENGIEVLLAGEGGVICTDANDFGRGRPHPASWGAYPRVLGRYVRERGTLSLENAILRMTSAPAGLLGIRDRGRIGAGCKADLVAFDPRTIGSSASFSDPRLPPDGISWVMLNGVIVAPREKSEPGAPTAGVVLRR